MLKRIRNWFGALFDLRSRDRALDAELQACVDILTAEKVRTGIPATEARRLALVELGGVQHVTQQVRDARPAARLDAWMWDLRYAFRALRRHRAFATTNVVLIAVCVALATTAFAVLDAVVLRRLPVPHPEQLVLINEIRTNTAVGTSALTMPLLEEIRRRTADTTQIFGFSGLTLGIGRDGDVRKGRVIGVSGDYFEALGAKPALGRLFGRDESQAVAVISDRFWRTAFGADPQIIGRAYQIGTMAVPIVGVTTPDFVGTQPDSAWETIMPLVWFQRARSAPDAAIYTARQEAGARLKPGVTPTQFESHLNAIWADAITAAAPPTGSLDQWRRERGTRVTARSLATGLSYLKIVEPSLARAITMTFVVTVVVCLAACLTIALLAVARGVRQQREMSVMLAIGSSRVRAVRPYLIEIATIAGVGCACGIALAASWVTIAATYAPGDWRISVDTKAASVAVVIAGTAAIAAAVFGVALLVRAPLQPSARPDARVVRPHVRLRTLLLTTQFAVAVALLQYGILYVDNVTRLLRVEPGFAVDGLQIFELSGRLPPKTLNEDYFRRLQASIRELPGVTDAALGLGVPFNYLPDASQAVSTQDREARAVVSCVHPGYLGVLRLPLTTGRDVSWTGTEAVITSNLAARLFPTGSAVGGTVRALDKTWQVVGISGDLTYRSPASGMTPMIFVPCLERYQPMRATTIDVMVRSSRTVADLEPDVRRVAGQLDAHYLFAAMNQTDVLANALKSERMLAIVSGAASTLIVVLTAAGLFGLCAYVFSLRRRELAIRAALGAGPRQIRALVLSETARVLVVGAFVGTAVTASAQYVATLANLELARPSLTYLGLAVAAMAAITIAAVALPTFRAVRQDLADALRLD
jgi:predicted permease